MNKILLSTLLATTVMFSSSLKAAENNMPTPPVHQEQVEMKKHHKGFDKNFHEKMAKKMAQDLELTPEQEEQAKKIRMEGREKIKPLIEEMKQLRQKIDEERKNNMEEFKNILTPEQKQKFDDMHKKAVDNFKKRIDKNFAGKKHHKGGFKHHISKDEK